MASEKKSGQFGPPDSGQFGPLQFYQNWVYDFSFLAPIGKIYVP